MRGFKKLFVAVIISAGVQAAILASGKVAPSFTISFDKSTPYGMADGKKVKLLISKPEYVKGDGNGDALRITEKRHNALRFPGKYIPGDAGAISLKIKLLTPSAAKTTRVLLYLSRDIRMVILYNRLIIGPIKTPELNLEADKWYNFVIDWRPAPSKLGWDFWFETSVFLDGKCILSEVNPFGPFTNPSSMVTVGCIPEPSYGRPQLGELDGDIDDLAIYSKWLTPYQVAKIAGMSDKAATENRLLKNTPVDYHPIVSKAKSKKFPMVNISAKRKIVIVSPSGDKSVYKAVQELTHYLSLILGRKISVKRTIPQGKDYYSFVLGNTFCAKADSSIPSKFQTDELFIRTNDDHTLLCGAKDNGALYAVYELLEGLGVRWFTPGKRGEVVPKLDSLSLKRGDTRRKPFFELRFQQQSGPYPNKLKGEHRRFQAWLRRCRTQPAVGYSRNHKMIAPHLSKLVSESLFATHPEYFGLDDYGKRGIPSRNRLNPCTSNPEVVNIIKKKAVEAMRSRPEAKYFCIEPIDGGGWCLCEKCLAIDAEHGNYSDRMVLLANKITEAIEKAFPGEGKSARFFAYQGYTEPPVKAKMNPRVQVQVTSATERLIKAWTEKGCRNLQKWGYAGYWTYHWGPFPSIHAIREEVKPMREYKLQGWFNESTASVSIVGAPAAYFINRMMYDPTEDPGAIIDDFFTKFYGPAAKPMRKCFDLLERESVFRWHGRLTYFKFIPRLYAPEIWNKCYKWIKEAYELAGDDELIKSRVNVTYMSYLISDVARDANVAESYVSSPKHPFWNYIEKRKASNLEKLLTALKLATKEHFTQVRSVHEEPGSLNVLVAKYAPLLRLDAESLIDFLTGKKSKVEAEKGPWKLVFEDSFERDALGDKWKVVDGAFEIKNGSLLGRGEIYLLDKFPGDQKIEFTGWVDSGKPACDVSAILAAAENRERGYKASYFFGFGNRGNVRNILMKNSGIIHKMNSPLIELGKKHHVVCEKQGRTLKWWIDGKLVMKLKDFGVLKGAYIGLYIYADAHVDDVKVYSKKK